MSEAKRGLTARIGVTLLNLLAPGLGLLPIGQFRRMFVVYGTACGAFLIFIGVLSTTERISFSAYAAMAAVFITVSLAAYVLAFWWTWQFSGAVVDSGPVWSRWYSIVGAAFLAFGISWVLTNASERLYKNFYIPAEAMEPTLNKWDRLLASMRRPSDIHRAMFSS